MPLETYTIGKKKQNNMATATELAEMVAEMRKAQGQFFNGLRTQTHLNLCKKLEKRVDDAVEEIIKKKPVQTKLF